MKNFNVFSQDICQYIGKFYLEESDFYLIEENLDEEFAYYEIASEDKIFTISIYLAKAQLESWQNTVNSLLKSRSIPIITNFSLNLIEDKDWVTEVAKSYLPVETELFFIKSSYYSGENTAGKIVLQIDPQRAFGTGEHETTRSCLDLLTHIDQYYKANNILDIGTGSGILSICSRKIWEDARIIGADIDEVSIKTAKENSKINGSSNIDFLVADGFYHPKITSGKNYDLIIINILANYLISFAEDLKSHLQENGYCILSGFLQSQEEMVIAKYRSLDFIVIEKINLNNWISIILRKQS